MPPVPVSTRQIPADTATIVADLNDLFLDVAGERLPLARRAQGNLKSLTGLTRKRLIERAGAGGIDMADQMRGTDTTMISCALQGDTIVALTGRTPSRITCEDVFSFLDASGFTVYGQSVIDGRCLATKISAKDVLIGGDVYHAGLHLDIDLAGHELPIVSTYVQRQVCVNGQVINLTREARRVPQYDDDGVVNAEMLTRHIGAWSSQGISDHILGRLQSASETPASFAEVLSLHSITVSPDIIGLRLSGASARGRVTTCADMAFEQMLGDYKSRFGVASLNEIPKRELDFLQSETSVAGLINLATELFTYNVRRDGGSGKLAHWWNRLLERTYHFEKVVKKTMPVPVRWLPHGNALSAN